MNNSPFHSFSCGKWILGNEIYLYSKYNKEQGEDVIRERNISGAHNEKILAK